MSDISHAKVLASDYANAIPGHYHRNRIGLAQRMVQRHANLAGLRAFDFGCGEGVFMRWLSGQGAIVKGCDPTASLVELAPEGAKLGGVEVMEKLPANSLDLVAALNVLSYCTLDERERFWRASARALASGGLVPHTNPNLFNASQAAKGKPDPKELPATLQANCFTEIDREFFGYNPIIFRWPTLYRLTRWQSVAPNLGLHPRGGRVYHPWRVAFVPHSWRAARSVSYFSIARKV